MLPALLAGCGGNTLLPPTTELTPDKAPDTGGAYPTAEDTASTGPERFNPFADPSEKPGDCGVGTPAARVRPYDGSCRWGWVHSRYVKVVAG